MFLFNCHRHWAQLLLHQTCDAPVIILSHYGVTQDDPLSIVLYGITLVTLEEELRDVDPTLLYPFYANNASYDGLARRSLAQLRLLMHQGMYQGYFS